MIRQSRLPSWFVNQSIRNKIVILYIPLVVLPLLALGYVSNRIYTESILQKTVQSIADSSQLIATRVQDVLQNMESCSNNITLSLNRVVKTDGDFDPGADPRYESQIVNQLSFGLLVFPDVDAAAFIDTSGRVYATAPTLQNGADRFADSPLLAAMKRSSGDSVWIGMQRRDYLTRSPEQTVLTLGKKVIEISTGQTLGWLVLNVDEKRLSGIFPEPGSEAKTTNRIANAAGMVVSSQEEAELLKPVRDEALRGWLLKQMPEKKRSPYRHGGKLAVGYPIDALGWTLLSEVPIVELTRDTDKISYLIAAIGAGCLLLVLSSAGLLSRSIATPLVRLTRTMRKVQEGALDARFETKGSDEIGLLGDGFNRMIGRIRELLGRVKAEQRQKREFELALIQSQIKPHFLYNTLDVIYTLSEMGRGRDVQRTTKALADFYRVVLSKGREWITIGEEIQNVRDYLAIQHIRYSDVFGYRIDVPSELASYPIPKLTLQPLVENAIYHGLKPADRFGSLSISGELRKDAVVLVVRDDGAGMDESKIGELQSDEREAPGSSSFGLRSVHSRLRLYFGEPYGIELDSKPGEGTGVTIRLPARTDVPAASAGAEEGFE